MRDEHHVQERGNGGIVSRVSHGCPARRAGEDRGPGRWRVGAILGSVGLPGEPVPQAGATECMQTVQERKRVVEQLGADLTRQQWLEGLRLRGHDGETAETEKTHRARQLFLQIQSRLGRFHACPFQTSFRPPLCNGEIANRRKRLGRDHRRRGRDQGCARFMAAVATPRQVPKCPSRTVWADRVRRCRSIRGQSRRRCSRRDTKGFCRNLAGTWRKQSRMKTTILVAAET